MYMRIIILFLFVSFSYGKVWAQSFTVNPAATKMGLNQNMQVDFVAEGSNISEFKPPVFGAFNVLSGPRQSSMTTNFNGKITESYTFTYILQPTVKGKLTIGAASVKINGKVYKTNPVTIEVTDAPQNQQSGRNNPQNQPNNQSVNVKDNILIKAFVSNENPYQGQQIILIYKIYTAVQVVNYQRPIPKLDGFWVQQENIPQSPQGSEEMLNGKKYTVATIYKSYLFPQKDGENIIKPIDMEIVVRVKSKRSSPFDDFFNNPFFDSPFGYEDIKTKVTSNAIKVRVKSLPTNKPPYFSGMTGNFNFSVKADKTKVKTGESITLKAQVNGQGNIKLIEPFELDLPADIEKFEPTTKENISSTGDLVSGSKTFEYLLIPHKEGDYTIPSMSFSYFDPTKGRYITLNSDEIPISVALGSDKYHTQPQGVEQSDITFTGKDIQFIRLKPGIFKNSTERYFLTIRYFVLLLIPLILFVLLVIFKQKTDKDKQNIALMKSRRAKIFARKQLKEAGKFMKENKAEAFYLSVSSAFNKYICDKTGIPLSELSKEKIREELMLRQVDESLTAGLIAHLEDCEIARYAPSGAVLSLKEMYERSVELLLILEKQVK